jgi:anti-sigma B factor antagonist
MKIEQRTIGDETVLTVVGDRTLSEPGAKLAAEAIRSAVQQGHDRIVLDLEQVRYVDGGGLSELVQAVTVVRRRGGSMRLANVTTRLKDLLVVTELLSSFGCFDHELDAVASLGRVRLVN